MKNLMNLEVSYRGNDQSDWRTTGTYKNVKTIHYDERGNLIIIMDDLVQVIDRTFVDDIQVEIVKE